MFLLRFKNYNRKYILPPFFAITCRCDSIMFYETSKAFVKDFCRTWCGFDPDCRGLLFAIKNDHLKVATACVEMN